MGNKRVWIAALIVLVVGWATVTTVMAISHKVPGRAGCPAGYTSC